VGILQTNPQHVSETTHTTEKIPRTKIVNIGSTGTSRKTSKDYTDYSKRRRNLVTIKLKNSIAISNIILKR
jgi:hypothetical protein